ncbi:hypothetical protein Plhal304r1_c013g0050531 [Plasmopara halstedii]
MSRLLNESELLLLRSSDLGAPYSEGRVRERRGLAAVRFCHGKSRPASE